MLVIGDLEFEVWSKYIAHRYEHTLAAPDTAPRAASHAASSASSFFRPRGMAHGFSCYINIDRRENKYRSWKFCGNIMEG